MLQRTLGKKLRLSASQYPVVSVTGPRQSGKTTLVWAAFPEYDYVSLEHPEQRAFALEDPRGFLGQFRRQVILDEVQRTPELFSYIQPLVEVDLLVEKGSALIPVEIKSGETLNPDFFAGIDYWRKLSAQPQGPSALIYAGDESYKRREVGVYSWKNI